MRRPPSFASEDWLLQQQLRAEIEADSWRRLREILAAPTPAAATPPQAASPPTPAPTERRVPTADVIELGGSIILKALVRSGLGVFGAYLAWIAAMDGGLGEFEVWLATGSGFLIVLAASMLDPFRRFVHFAAEALRFAILGGAAIGLAWAILQMSPGPA